MFKLNYFLLLILVLISSCAHNYDEELRTIPEYMALTETIKKQKTFAGFNPMESWRLLIDGRKQSQGPLVFDKEEPGYLAGLSRGLIFALKHAHAPLSVEFIEELREQATKDVTKTDDTGFNREIGGNKAYFNLVMGSNATEEGLAELETSLVGDSLRRITTNDKNKLQLERDNTARKNIYSYVNTIIENYEKSDKTLRDIVILSQKLDQLHPFNDGNIRTFVLCLLQKELARGGFTPAIFYNPNQFDAYSVEQLLDALKSGQAVFKSYKNPE